MTETEYNELRYETRDGMCETVCLFVKNPTPYIGKVYVGSYGCTHLCKYFVRDCKDRNVIICKFKEENEIDSKS